MDLDHSEITLRPARPEDVDWLELLYDQVMRPHVELTREWVPGRFRESFDPDTSWVVRWEGRDIGFLKFVEFPDYLFLRSIQIHPDYQRRGIGTALLQYVIARGDELGVPVQLRILPGNPAQALYERLGFKVTCEFPRFREMERPCFTAKPAA